MRILRTVGAEPQHQLHGMYGSSVFNNRDPKGKNRVELHIPQVLGTAISNWADPIANSSGKSPAVGTYVVCVFIGGDINRPAYVPPEWSKPYVPPAPSAWQLITPSGGWSTVGGFTKPQVRKTADDSIEIAGNLSGGTTTDGTTIGTLPSGSFSTSAGSYIPLQVVAGASPVSTPVSGASLASTAVTTGALSNLSGSIDAGQSTNIPTGNHTIASTPATLGPSGINFSNTISGATITLNSGTITSQSLANGTINSQTVNISYNSPCLEVDTSGNLKIFNISIHTTQIAFGSVIPLSPAS